jgi:hypothetical protein
MCKVVYWRDVFAQHGGAFTTNRRLTDPELEAKGEDPAQAALVAAVKNSVPVAAKQSTWFCPTGVEGVADLVLGWDHGVLLEDVGGHFEVQRVFRHANAVFTVAKNRDETWNEVETWQGWTVYEPPAAMTIRRVLTYGATSCSVTLLVPEGAVNRAIMCHMDSAPPIPLNVILSWRAAKAVEVACHGTPKYKVISSICGPEEGAKFKMDTCLQGIDCEAKRLLLVRTTQNVRPDIYPEPHTQIGVSFSDAALPLVGYLGFPDATTLALQWPNPNQQVHQSIKAVVAKMRRIAETRALRAQLQQTIDELQLLKAGYENDVFVISRGAKIKETEQKIAAATDKRDDCDQALLDLPVGVPETAQAALAALRSNAYGFPTLYAGILQRMAQLNALAPDEQKLLEIYEYAGNQEVALPLQQAIPDALRELPRHFVLPLASFDTLYQ